jgi:hypothetical protein
MTNLRQIPQFMFRRQPTAIKPEEYAAQLRVAARRSSLTTDNARL